MLTVLVAYASKNGSTAEIARAITGELNERGLRADCLAAREVERLDGYDAVVLGSAVYMKRWRPDARRLLRKHARELSERPFWIFSSGPVGEKRDPAWEEPPKVIARAEALGVREHVVFGGRVPQDPSNFLERAMLQNTPSEYADLRDWDEIRAWAGRIAAALSSQAQAAAVVGADPA